MLNEVSAASYPIACEILDAMHENHMLIAQEHLKALFAVASFETLTMSKVNLQQLERLGKNLILGSRISLGMRFVRLSE